MAVARKMPGDLGGTRKKATVKKTTVKKVSVPKYAATKKPNRATYPFGEYVGSPGQSKASVAKGVKNAVKKQNTIKKNAAANRVRDTKPGMTNNGQRRRAL